MPGPGARAGISPQVRYSVSGDQHALLGARQECPELRVSLGDKTRKSVPGVWARTAHQIVRPGATLRDGRAPVENHSWQAGSRPARRAMPEGWQQ